MDARKLKGNNIAMWSPSSSSSTSHHHQMQWGSESSSGRGGSIISNQDDMEDTAYKPPSARKLHHHLRRQYRRKKASRDSLSRWYRVALWPSLIAVVVVIWLIFEVFHFSQDHVLLPRKLGTFNDFRTSEISVHNKTKKDSNLNNLDMPTRFVNGSRESCLKLISAEEMAKLTFPLPSSSGTLKALHYKSLGSTPGDAIPASRTDLLFTGNQTMEERERTYELTENMEVHCGFFGGDSVFHVDDEDKAFLRGCEAVVSTCNFGGGDDIYQPINMTTTSLSKVCYVAFWDKVTLEAQAIEGRNLDSSRKIGHWRIVVVENLPFADQRLNGKIPKMLGHRLFPNAKYSIWVDSKSQFRRDPLGVWEALLWRTNSTMAISEHGARDCVYKEAQAVVKKNKATPQEVAIQIDQYRKEGFPEKARIDGHKALAEASVIVREHTPMTNLFMCLWFNEVTRFTARDQLSFPYVLKRLGMHHLNMFPVCTRKALVNSLGHVRKTKPLDTVSISGSLDNTLV